MAASTLYRILLDECVQAAVVGALADDGHDVVRPEKVGMPESPADEAVLEMAVAEDRILVTTDVDLLRVHERWISQERDHLGIVLGQQDPSKTRSTTSAAATA